MGLEATYHCLLQVSYLFYLPIILLMGWEATHHCLPQVCYLFHLPINAMRSHLSLSSSSQLPILPAYLMGLEATYHRLPRVSYLFSLPIDGMRSHLSLALPSHLPILPAYWWDEKPPITVSLKFVTYFTCLLMQWEATCHCFPQVSYLFYLPINGIRSHLSPSPSSQLPILPACWWDEKPPITGSAKSDTYFTCLLMGGEATYHCLPQACNLFYLPINAIRSHVSLSPSSQLPVLPAY